MPPRARVGLPWDALRGRGWRLTDLVDGRVYDRDGDELASTGLDVDLAPWAAHVLSVDPR